MTALCISRKVLLFFLISHFEKTWLKLSHHPKTSVDVSLSSFDFKVGFSFKIIPQNYVKENRKVVMLKQVHYQVQSKTLIDTVAILFEKNN
jgi:hypothetical protein